MPRGDGRMLYDRPMPPTIGKAVAGHTYLYVGAVDKLAPDSRELLRAATSIARVPEREDAFNVIKICDDGQSLTLLDYPRFVEDAFPALRRYWSVDLGRQTARFRTYETSLNPPILHRKELLLPEGHPQRDVFSALTMAAERLVCSTIPRASVSSAPGIRCWHNGATAWPGTSSCPSGTTIRTPLWNRLISPAWPVISRR